MSTTVFFNKEAKKLALSTQDAYSADFASIIEWERASAFLLENYTYYESEAVLRSKWTRWCRDAYSEEGEFKGKYLVDFIGDPRNKCTIEAVRALV